MLDLLFWRLRIMNRKLTELYHAIDWTKNRIQIFFFYEKKLKYGLPFNVASAVHISLSIVVDPVTSCYTLNRLDKRKRKTPL